MVLKKLAGSIRQYLPSTIATPLLVLGEVVLECTIPFYIAELVNRIKAGADVKEIAGFGGILTVMAIGSLIFGMLAGMTCATAACGFGQNLRLDMYDAVNGFSFDNIDRFSTSSLVTRMTTDITNVQNAFMMLTRIAVRAPFMMVFAFVMAFRLAGRMAWIFAAVVPILAATLIMVASRAMPLFRRIFRKYDRMNESIEENIMGMRVVKSFVREDYEEKKFDVTSEEVRKDFTRAEKILAWNAPVMQFCLYVVMVFVLTFGSYVVISTSGMEFDVGQISASLTYSFMILSSLMMMSMIFVMITLASESAARIAEVLDEKSNIVSPDPESAVETVADGSIEFRGVSFAYAQNPDNDVLTDIDLRIETGMTVGIIGSTGSGKSSLVQLIPRLYDATRGEVYVGNVNVKDYDLSVLRKNVAMVLQKNVLFEGTIADNLRWGNPDATLEEIKEACRLSCAEEFISSKEEGYDYMIDHGGVNISGGQKQRLCIARALLTRPRIIIFDDSTSAVDTRTDAMIRKGMREYIPETTKIIIAQRTASVEDADMIVVIDGGRIVNVGNHEELLNNSAIYREIYTSQNSGRDKDAGQEKGGDDSGR
ncbi:MAG: ABC transporter ATP-binding protein/permease [Lachnospiraceae bacterium]|nr:ABC transporter ATP-binding protein/permease [Lachnospiraceae bacterium]